MEPSVFLDTNIFLDHFLYRNKRSTRVLELCEQGLVMGFAATASFFTIAYFLEKSKRDAKQVLRSFSEFIELIPTTKENLLSAYDSSFQDLEDSFQYYTALNEPALDFFYYSKHERLQASIEEITGINPRCLFN